MKKKKILSIILAVVLVVGVSTLLAYTAAKFFVQKKNVEETGNVLGISWYNESDTEFVISTPEELREFARLSEYYTFENQIVKLDADLVLNEGNAEDFEEQKPENNWKPIMNFAGTFDGQGHTISGLYVRRGGETAMFLRSDTHCVVKDFSLKNSYFDTYGYSGVATIMARGGGKFSGIYTDAIINHRGQNVGGIASQVKKTATFEECWFDGSITITHRGCGGIIDVVDAARVTMAHCLYTGSIDSGFDGTGTLTTGTKTGGMIGHVNVGCSLRAEDCFSSGSIKIKGTYYTGGLIGVGSAHSSIVVRNSYVSDQTYNVATGIAVGTVDGDALVIRSERLIGTKAYEWTDLDFDNYWAAIDKSTPILKRFAESSLDLTGVKKAFDTSWYSANGHIFTITTPEQLFGWTYVSALDKFPNKVVKLGADIVLNEGNAADWEKKAPANSWDPILGFAGTFDGQGYTISGIYSVSDAVYQGFIKEAAETSTIRNLNIKNSFFYNRSTGDLASLGSLVGETRGKVENIYSNAIIISDASQVGGIIGRTNDNDSDNKKDTVEVRGCWFDGSVSLRGEKTMEAGGIIGRAVQGDLLFENCLNTGVLSAEINNNVPGLGGLIGVSWASGFTMSNCFSDGKLTYAFSNGNGGAVGRMPSKFTVADISSVYTTKEACIEGGMGAGVLGTVNGGIVQLLEDWYIGQNAARYTDLDFDKTWVLQKDGTPRLAHFSKGEVSAKGVKKAYDNSWYKKDAKEVVIKTPEQLLGFTIIAMSDDFAGRTVKLGADIKMNLEKDWISIGSKAKLFAGTFDGQGYTISGLKQKSSSSQMGLFGSTSITSKLKNFSLKDSTFEYYNESANEKEIFAQIGTVCSDLRGDVEKVYSNATITSNAGYVGGLVGAPNAQPDDKGKYTTITIKDCWFDGEVKMTGRWARFGGGVAGVLIQGNFEFINCLNSGTVSNERPDGGEFIGGIVGTDGNNYINCLIKDCLNTGTINVAHWNSAGAILGAVWKNTGVFTIENTYALDTSAVNQRGELMLANRNAGTLNGGVTAISGKELTGAGAYIWTTLNFKDHWAALEDGYPVLKAFQKGIPLDEYKQMVDTSWYDEKKDSFTLKDEADLYGLARLVNAGNSFKGKTVKLDADIKINAGNAENYKTQAPTYEWTPIGSSEANKFKGTFDGNMHTISGVYMNRAERFGGLFGVTEDATIKDLKVKNSYMASSAQWLGTLVGRGSVTVKNVYANTIVEGAEAFTGGFVGQTDYSDSKFDNCWFDGTIINTYDKAINSRGFVGGFIGYAIKTTEIKDCLYTGHIDISKMKVQTAAGTGGFIGVAANTLKLDDSAMLGSIKAGSIAGYYAYLGVNETTTFEGKDVYSVHQVPNSDCTTWAGNYGGHGVSTFKHTPLANRAAALGSKAKNNMSSLDWLFTWKVNEIGTPVLKVFEDEREEYTITDKQGLYDLASLVNTGTNFQGKTIKLGADIELNTGSAEDYATQAPKYTWKPIGYENVAPFKGTLDGQGHTISGLYINSTTHYSGLFGAIDGATVKNLKLMNSYIASTGQWVGSIAGRGNGNFENVYSNAIVKSSKAFIGGLFGQLETTKSQLKGCWFDGTVISTSSGNSAGFIGGLIGYAANEVVLTDCLNTGHIDITGTNNTTAGTGGFIGVLDAINKVATFNNCAMLGSIKADGKNGFYAIVGDKRNGSFSGSNIYIKVDRHSTAHTHFQGAYPGAAIAGFSPTRVTYANVIGDAAKTTMPKLDWTNTWQTVSGKVPVLKWTTKK